MTSVGKKREETQPKDVSLDAHTFPDTGFTSVPFSNSVSKYKPD